MRVSVLGHAGLLIETQSGSIACDPWFEPAFLGSWFVWPRNDRLTPELMAKVTTPSYLYISHLHGDHLDQPFLRDRMSKDVTVLLPDFPTDELERELRALGFERFVRCPDSELVDLDAMQVMICTETAVTDGPQGDSMLVVADSTGCIVNQNDCRPHDFDAVRALGPIDVQFLQYSGAIWYPMVYEMEPDEQARLRTLKRGAQLARALQYTRMLGARAVVPFAGPPAFLAPELRHLNDLGDGPSIFPDQRVFLRLLADEPVEGLFTAPGSEVIVADGRVEVNHPDGEAAARWPYEHKAQDLATYAEDWVERLGVLESQLSDPAPDLVARLAEWWEPLLQGAPMLRAGIGADVLIRSGDTDVLIDVAAGQVRAWRDEPYSFRFVIDRRVLETVVARRAVDWSNALFLSCRFSAWRQGGYNEYVYNFFKSLSPERMGRAEAEAAAAAGVLSGEDALEFRCGDMLVERFCPHRRADLTLFGQLDGDTLTCTLHGWKFDVRTGDCLTSPDRWLRVRPA